jgi:hypothetical protein
MSSNFKPSEVDIISVKLKNYAGDKELEISAQVFGISFYQSIEATSWSGMMQILDTTGLLEKFPLRGEESLDIILHAHDLDYEINLKCHLHKIDGVETTTDADGVTFTAHFMSKTSFHASNKKVSRGYTEFTAAEIAETVFKTFYNEIKLVQPKGESDKQPYGGKKYSLIGVNDSVRGVKKHLFIQPSSGVLRSVIPNYPSADAMTFCARRSFSNNSTSSSFRFFETLNSYEFVTDEYLIKRATDTLKGKITKIKYLAYGAIGTIDPREPIGQIETIETFANPKRISIANDVYSGGYKNTIFEIDLTRRKVSVKEFDYTKNGNFISMGGVKPKNAENTHTQKFVDETFTANNSKRMLMFKDYSSADDIANKDTTLRSDQHYPEIVSNRVAYNHHVSNTETTIMVRGRLDIMPGDVVSIDAKGFSGNRDGNDNDQLSGKYLVHTSVHSISDDILTTDLRLIKYDWSS